MLELEKTFVDDKTKLILKFLNCSESYMRELNLSDSHCEKLQYPIVRRKFYLSYDLTMIDKMEGFEFEEYVFYKPFAARCPPAGAFVSAKHTCQIL